MYPLVRELADDGIPVTVTCRVLDIARQPYYRWLASPVTDAELTAAYRANALFDAHRDDPEFGYRFLVDEAREAGEPMAERPAWRICSELGWWSAFGKKRGRNGKKPGPPVHDDLVERDLGHPRGAADRDRALGREDLPPTPPTGSPEPVDPDRVRVDHDHNRHPGGLTETVTGSCSRPAGAFALLCGPICAPRRCRAWEGNSSVVRHRRTGQSPSTCHHPRPVCAIASRAGPSYCRTTGVAALHSSWAVMSDAAMPGAAGPVVRAGRSLLDGGLQVLIVRSHSRKFAAIAVAALATCGLTVVQTAQAPPAEAYNVCSDKEACVHEKM